LTPEDTWAWCWRRVKLEAMNAAFAAAMKRAHPPAAP
jgi:hypothetical protein